MKNQNYLRIGRVAAATAILLGSLAALQAKAQFLPGELVISTVSNSDPGAANSSLDTASPITLDNFVLGTGGTSATLAGTEVLPQATVGNESAISGEYGSASEGILQDSVDGQYLTMMGYGVNAATFNTLGTSTYGTTALGQTTSIAGGSATVVPRVVALIGANGSVNTTTALTGIYNMNNPRSATTVNGTSVYVSGQGVTGDGTGGVFYAPVGATTATAIDNSTETRAVSIDNTGSGNTLYVSRDVKVGGGANNSTNISSLTTATGALPTSSAGVTATHIVPPASPLSLGGNNGSINLTAALDNNVNSSRNGKFVYLSPEQFFFASASVLYVTDSGQPKNGNADAAALGEGGLQKWVYSNGAWNLQYDLYAGLNLVDNATANSSTPTAPGVTGLFGLTGKVVGGNVELFATSYGLNELSSSSLYEITDSLTATTGAGESFTTLENAPAGTLFRGVAFAPQAVPEPPTSAMFLLMLGVGAGAFVWQRRRAVRA